jgi:drug/metabolite transporter (DMT)-like permease
VAVETIPPITTTALRIGIAALILAVILRRAGIRLLRADYPWRLLSLQAAMINVLPWTLTAWAAQTIDSGLVTILNSTSPIFAFVVTWAITRHEPATAGKLAGALTGLAGVALIVGMGAFAHAERHLLQQLACVFGALLFGVAAVHGRRFEGLPPLVPATLTLVVGSAVLLPLAVVVDRPWTITPSRASLVALLGLSVFSTAAALYLYYRILAAMGSLAAASQSYLRIIVGVVAGIVFLGETLTPERAGGMLLILAGVIAMTHRPAPSPVAARDPAAPSRRHES